jgi:predicted amidophosphoribosyltransferase
METASFHHMLFRICPACTLPVREDRRWCGDCGHDMKAAEQRAELQPA